MKLKRIVIILIAAMLSSVAALAQSNFHFPVNVEKKLAARASSHTEVNLDRKMLQLGSQFMDKDDAATRAMLQKLNGVYVRTYQFSTPGQYTAADLDAIRRQFNNREWTPIVEQSSKNGSGDSDVYIKSEGGEIVGMFVLSAQPKELDLVYLSGPINLNELSGMGGNFGIPTLQHRGNGTAKSAGK